MSKKGSEESYVWISYSDLMTSVTFAFIFLFLVFVAKYREENQKNKSLSEEVSTVSSLIAAQNRSGDILEELKRDLSAEKDCDGVGWEVNRTESLISATVSETTSREKGAWFKSGESELQESAKRCLDVFSVKWLKAMYGDIGIRKNIQGLVIEGHTDSDPIRTKANRFLGNLELSQERAYNAAVYIIEHLTKERFAIDSEENWNNFRGWTERVINATGRSYAKLIGKGAASDSDGYVVPGTEDKRRSRRIEFRTLIRSDFDAMKTLVNEFKKK